MQSPFYFCFSLRFLDFAERSHEWRSFWQKELRKVFLWNRIGCLYKSPP
ncbi:hypothetical protein EVA_05865 [gut metagenome]|uniref:Uncharacterized protein n=1 Tax=gut metagenome TaxID=749906 RepID=J9GTK4_9ZZZZ